MLSLRVTTASAETYYTCISHSIQYEKGLKRTPPAAFGIHFTTTPFKHDFLTNVCHLLHEGLPYPPKICHVPHIPQLLPSILKMATQPGPQSTSGSAASKINKATTSEDKKEAAEESSRMVSHLEQRSMFVFNHSDQVNTRSSALVSDQTLKLPSDPIQRRQIEMLKTLSTSLNTSIASLLVSYCDPNEIKSLLDGITTSVATIRATAGPENTVGAFIRFSSLPPELRRMIWKLALPGPRVVEVIHVPATGKTPPKLRLGCAMPALTHACAESRRVAFEKYRVKITMYDGDCGRIDPKEDIVYFSKGNEFIAGSAEFSDDALESIETVAIDHPWHYDDDDAFEPGLDFMLFMALKKILINLINVELYGGYYHGRCQKERYNQSLVDITMTPRKAPYSDYLQMVEEHLYEREYETMKEYMDDEEDEEDDDWVSGITIPEIQIAEMERKEKKPRKTYYWGY